METQLLFNATNLHNIVTQLNLSKFKIKVI